MNKKLLKVGLTAVGFVTIAAIVILRKSPVSTQDPNSASQTIKNSDSSSNSITIEGNQLITGESSENSTQTESTVKEAVKGSTENQTTESSFSSPQEEPHQNPSHESTPSTATSTASNSHDHLNSKVQSKTESNVNSTPPEKKITGYPGINQKPADLMVSDIKVSPGEGKDKILITLSNNNPSKTYSGKIWVIGEYIQRGTTGVMFMPSHNDLQLSPEGLPNNPNTGLAYQVKTNLDRNFTLTRPGFDGEELTGVRVGLVDASGQIHIAKISTQLLTKRKPIKRAKVNSP